MADYGFRISHDSIDVKTGADEDMVVTSKYANLKGSLSGGGSALCRNADGGFKTVTVAHNLGYIPMARVIADEFNSGWFYNAPYFDNGGMYETSVTFRMDATNLYIDFYYLDYGGADVSIPYKYFIFLDPAKI